MAQWQVNNRCVGQRLVLKLLQTFRRIFRFFFNYLDLAWPDFGSISQRAIAFFFFGKMSLITQLAAAYQAAECENSNRTYQNNEFHFDWGDFFSFLVEIMSRTVQWL